MGATRLVLTVGVVGLAAGAALAVAIVPSMAPYRHRDRSEMPVVVREEAADTAYGLDRDSSDPGLRIAPGTQRGTLVLHLPRWAEDTGAWLAYGQRAWQTWRSWSEPAEDRSDTDHSEGRERFVGRRDWQDETPYGGADRGGDRWAASPDAVQARADAQSDRESRGNADRSVSDDAAEAARDALDAAQDVRDAEGSDW